MNLDTLKSIAAVCSQAHGGQLVGLEGRKVVFQSPRFNSTTVVHLPEALGVKDATAIFQPEEGLMGVIQQAYRDSLSILAPVLKTVRTAINLLPPSAALAAIKTAAGSSRVDLDKLTTAFRLQITPILQGIDLDIILAKYAPVRGGDMMAGAHMPQWGGGDCQGAIQAWNWSWTELEPQIHLTHQAPAVEAISPMRFVNEDEMIMLTAQALDGRLKLNELPYNKVQLDAMEIRTRIRLALQGLKGHPHTLVEGAQGKTRFVYVDPWNRNLVKTPQCPTWTVQVRRAFRGAL